MVHKSDYTYENKTLFFFHENLSTGLILQILLQIENTLSFDILTAEIKI